MNTFTTPRRNVTLRRQARKIIYNVHKYMQKESVEGAHNIHQVQKRTAEATGTSVNTVQRILKEAKESEISGVFHTPGKKRPRTKPVVDIGPFDQGIIKRCVHNFHITHKELPSIKKLQTKLRSDINFQGSGRSLSRIIKNLGFQWKKTENNRKFLIEKTEIRLKRIEYLEKLKKYRQDRRPIIYTAESLIHASSGSKSDQGVKVPISKGQRVIVAHAGSEAAFVPNALLMFISGSKTGNYHDEMNFENYRKWLETQLLPNLPPKSVLVVDNASYHNKQNELVPNSNSKKSVMECWLREKGINYNATMLKPELYNLIQQHKEPYKKFDIDQMMHAYGHDVLRLPPYHPDLNPMEMAWAVIKGFVSSNVDRKVNRVMELIKEKFDDMGANEWRKLCENVKMVEESYAKCDDIIDQMTEEFIIHLNPDSSSESEQSSSSDEDVPSTDRYVQPDHLMKEGVILRDRVRADSDDGNDIKPPRCQARGRGLQTRGGSRARRVHSRRGGGVQGDRTAVKDEKLDMDVSFVPEGFIKWEEDSVTGQSYDVPLDPPPIVKRPRLHDTPEANTSSSPVKDWVIKREPSPSTSQRASPTPLSCHDPPAIKLEPSDEMTPWNTLNSAELPTLKVEPSYGSEVDSDDEKKPCQEDLGLSISITRM